MNGPVILDDSASFLDVGGELRRLIGEKLEPLVPNYTDPEREALRADLRAHGFDVDAFERDELAAGRPDDVIEAIEREALRQLQAPQVAPRTGSKYAKARAKYAKQRREKSRAKRKRGRR